MQPLCAACQCSHATLHGWAHSIAGVRSQRNCAIVHRRGIDSQVCYPDSTTIQRNFRQRTSGLPVLAPSMGTVDTGVPAPAPTTELC